MSDITIEMAEILARHAGITFDQANYILSESKVVNLMNFKDWLLDIDRIVKLDTVDG